MVVGIQRSLGLLMIGMWILWRRFYKKIQQKRVSQDLEDRVLWIVTKCRKFSVKSIYDVLEPSDAVLFPRSIIWSPCVPPKAGFSI